MNSHADVEVEGAASEYETPDEDSEEEYFMIRDILHARVSDEKWVANEFDKVSAALMNVTGHG